MSPSLTFIFWKSSRNKLPHTYFSVSRHGNMTLCQWCGIWTRWKTKVWTWAVLGKCIFNSCWLCGCENLRNLKGVSQLVVEPEPAGFGDRQPCQHQRSHERANNMLHSIKNIGNISDTLDSHQTHVVDEIFNFPAQTAALLLPSSLLQTVSRVFAFTFSILTVLLRKVK